MKKGKERRRHELVCDYCGCKFKSSKSHSRFDSSEHRFYFFAKKKILLAYIQSQEVKETIRFNDFLQNVLQQGEVGKKELLNFIKDHKETMSRFEWLRHDAELLLINLRPAKTKLTQKTLETILKMIPPSSVR